jgi:hypothetical protein
VEQITRQPCRVSLIPTNQRQGPVYFPCGAPHEGHGSRANLGFALSQPIIIHDSAGSGAAWFLPAVLLSSR